MVVEVNDDLELALSSLALRDVCYRALIVQQGPLFASDSVGTDRGPELRSIPATKAAHERGRRVASLHRC